MRQLTDGKRQEALLTVNRGLTFDGGGGTDAAGVEAGSADDWDVLGMCREKIILMHSCIYIKHENKLYNV